MNRAIKTVVATLVLAVGAVSSGFAADFMGLYKGPDRADRPAAGVCVRSGPAVVQGFSDLYISRPDRPRETVSAAVEETHRITTPALTAFSTRLDADKS